MTRPVRRLPRAPEVEEALAAGSITRDQAQGRGVRGAGKRTVGATELRERVRLDVFQLDDDDLVALAARPKTRGECVDGPRPCPWLGCRYHLAIEAKERSIVERWPADEDGLPAFDKMPFTCALDVADQAHESDSGMTTLEDIGAVLNLTRERVRQLEVEAMGRLKGIDGLRLIHHDMTSQNVGAAGPEHEVLR